MQKCKVNGQSVTKIEWKQTDRRTDGGDRITSLANAVGNQNGRKETSSKVQRNAASSIKQLCCTVGALWVVSLPAMTIGDSSTATRRCHSPHCSTPMCDISLLSPEKYPATIDICRPNPNRILNPPSPDANANHKPAIQPVQASSLTFRTRCIYGGVA